MNTFITTAIDYPNAKPHIGTAFEKIGADVYARFRRFQGRNVYFLIGNDENTIKVVKRAKELNKPVQEYANEMAEQFKETWQKLNISYDDFIQTSESRHHIGVQYFLNAVHKAGFIEKRTYKGLYCEGCEEYKTECQNHQKLELREEENYFFLLSKFKQQILDNLCAEPESRYNEVKNFVEKELTDISISRNNEGWGIPIPWDHSHVTYVWFDALLNYLTGIGFGTDWNKFNQFWPAEIHFVGKDITRFHCALFPAMCLAYNEGNEEHKISLPTRVFAHGFIYERKGKEIVKSSKSGQSTNPIELIDQFGTDAYRYYFMSKCNYHSDGEFSFDHFKEVYNADLSNNLGNLVSRTVSMIQQYFNGIIYPKQLNDTENGINHFDDYEKSIQNIDYRSAINIIMNLVNQSNLYIEQEKPWKLNKENKNKLKEVLTDLVLNLRIISLFLIPFMPDTAKKIYEMFDWKEKWQDLSWGNCRKNVLMESLTVNQSKLNDGKVVPLFPKV